MKIKDLLTDESKWTNGAYAKNSSGANVGIHDLNAACWCLSGAIRRCYSTSYLEVRGVLARVARHVPSNVGKEKDNVVAFNDDPNTTFADVRALIERLDI